MKDEKRIGNMNRFRCYTLYRQNMDIGHRTVLFFDLPLKVQLDYLNGHKVSKWGRFSYGRARK